MTTFRTALITGGASGIGRALAVQLAEERTRVVAADRDEAALARLAREANQRGLPIETATLDVTDREAFASVASRIDEAHDGLDLLINNAGIGIAGELRDMQPDDWRRVVEVNFFGVVHGVDAAYPHMIRRRRGHIVNVSSLAGLIPLPGESIYVASKHAVVGLTRTLEAEARGYGVDVTLVCPGVVDTPIYDTSPVVGFDKEASLALWPDGVSPDACAREILSGLQRRRRTIIVTPMARALAAVQRASPRLFQRAAALYMSRLRRTRSGATDPEADLHQGRPSARHGH